MSNHDKVENFCVSFTPNPPREPDEPTADNVNHPLHYTAGTNGIECIDAIEAAMSVVEFRGYLRGNVIKYLWRCRLKGHVIEDLKKARWYLDRLIRSYDL